jgi:serine/threonine protein kinase
MDEELLDSKYKVLRVLGKGAFGQVLLAHDKIANNNVAIKEFYNHEFNEESIIKEIQFLATLNHHSIVRFFHHFIYNSSLHIVLEYCPNGSLLDIISQKGKLDVDTALSYSLKIAETLIFIHKKGIIHSDIKPSNILFNSEEEIKISDFGVANSRSVTFIYQPPELFSSQNVSSKDSRIDIYALGITLLETILGKNPFSRYETGEIMSAKISHSFIPYDLPHWLQEIILKSTHPSPDLRFQIAEEFFNALKSKSVLYSINKEFIKADKLFAYADKCLSQKRWLKSVNFIKKGVEISRDSVLGNITAGKYHLKTNNLILAKKYFEKALNLNPGVNIKKRIIGYSFR